MCPIAHVPYCPCVSYCPCALLPKVPIPQGPPSVSAVFTNIPFTHVPHWPCAPLLMCQKDVKLSKRCQMSKSQTHRLWRRFTKKINWHNEVHTYWHQFWHQIWRSPKLFKNTLCSFWGFLVTIICDIKIDVKMGEPHYVNLFLLWTSSIVYVSDFLTFWHLF